MNCPVEFDDDIKRRLAHLLLMPIFEADTEVVGMVRNTVQKAAVNCDVTSEANICKGILDKGSSIRSPSQAIGTTKGCVESEKWIPR